MYCSWFDLETMENTALELKYILADLLSGKYRKRLSRKYSVCVPFCAMLCHKVDHGLIRPPAIGWRAGPAQGRERARGIAAPECCACHDRPIYGRVDAPERAAVYMNGSAQSPPPK